MAHLGDTKAVSLTLLDGVIGNLNPKVTTTYDLGTSSLKWNNIYAATLNGSLAASNITGTLGISNGGTGATTAAGARANLGTWALVSDTYPTIVLADGSNNWVKIGKSNSSFGLLPSTSGSAGSGHNYIGTSTWYWKYAYIDEIYGHLNGNADTASRLNITSTDNAIARFDGTNGTIQDSGVIIDDNNNLTTSELTVNKLFHPVTGTATAAVTSSPYKGTLWTFNLGIAKADLASGDTIMIKTPNGGHDYGVFISVDNGATYKPITTHYSTSRLTTNFPSGATIMLCYDASGSAGSMYGQINASGTVDATSSRVTVSGGCWRVMNLYLDGNSGDWNLRQYTIKAAAAITAGHIIGGTDSGYKNIDAGNAFDIRYAVLYAGSAISSGSTGSNNYVHHYAISIQNSSNSNISGWTSYKNLYIKGTISGNTFTPISGGNPYVQDITAADDGYVYYYIGRTYSGSAITFDATGRDIYIYKDGGIQKWSGYSASATKLISTPNNTTTFLRGDNTWSNTLTGDFNVNGNATLSGETTADNLTTGNLTVNGSANFVNIPTLSVSPAAASNDTSVATTAFVKTTAGNYLPLAGGTMTGQIIFPSQAAACNEKNIKFSSGGYIGGDTYGDVGIYATAIYLRAGNKDASSGQGLIMTTGQQMNPYADNVFTLGTSSLRFKNIYAVTFNGALSGTAEKATADGSGNNIVNTYLTKAAGVTNVAWDNTNKKLTKTINGSTTDIVTPYAANLKLNNAAAYNTEPEVKSIKIGNGTTATATKSVQLVYDATLEVLNFVFS